MLSLALLFWQSTIGYTFFYIVKNVSIVANIREGDCCEVRCSSWHAAGNTSRQRHGGRSLLWSFQHLPCFLNTRETGWHYMRNDSIKNDDRGTWIKLPDGGKAYLQDSLLILPNVSDGSTVTHRRELLFFCPPCRCTDGDSILPSHVGSSSLKHERKE